MRIHALALVIVAACAATPSFPADGSPLTYEVQPEPEAPYRIAPQDSLAIRYSFNREHDLQLEVRPDGKISIPFAEEVHAAGRTVAELDTELTAVVGKSLKNPELTIIVTKFATQRVFVGGEVNRPGVFELSGGLTALQALTIGGGLKTSAAADSVLLIRAAGPGKREVRRIDLSVDGLVKADYVLRPFDIVYAPKSGIAKVGDWVEQNINALLPRAFSFGAFYDLNETALIK